MGRHFEFESQDRSKIQYSIRSAKPELVENDTSQVLITHLARGKSLFMYLDMALEATTGDHLGFKCQDGFRI